MGWIAENLQKLMENISFFGILGCLKRWLKHFFGDVGSKMAFFEHLASTCGTCWRQDGQQDGQDGQHEGQDGQHEGQDGRKKAKMALQLNSIDAGTGVLGPLKGLKPRSIEAQKTR